MATLSITKNWADGEILLEADLDEIKTDVETFLNTTKINDDNIQTSGITASSKLIDASISTAKLADSSVTTAKINDSAVTTAKINDSAVTTAKINASAVTKAKLATAARDPTTQSKSADFTAALTVDNYYVDTSGATVTATLTAAASSDGHEFTFTKTSGSNTLVIDGNASETINGAATLTLYEQYETVTIYCEGTTWYIRNRYIPGNTFQPVVVRAKRTSSLSVPNTTDTAIVYDTEAIDNKSAYNSSTGTFTCPTGCGGDYLISAFGRMDNAGSFWESNEGFYLGYKVNGGSIVYLDSKINSNNNGAEQSAGGMDVVTLAAGDTVVIYAYQDSDATANLINSSTENHMAIVRIR